MVYTRTHNAIPVRIGLYVSKVYAIGKISQDMPITHTIIAMMMMIIMMMVITKRLK
jgi:hypothetical protein